MKNMSLEDQLKNKKIKFLRLNDEINELKQKIAESKCPYTIGDIIQCNDGIQTTSFVVNSIYSISTDIEVPLPIVDVETTYGMSGHRVNKDGKVSRFRYYSVKGYEVTDRNGYKVTVKKWGLNEKYGVDEE